MSGKHHVFVADEVAGKMRPMVTLEPVALRSGSCAVGGPCRISLTPDVHARRCFRCRHGWRRIEQPVHHRQNMRAYRCCCVFRLPGGDELTGATVTAKLVFNGDYFSHVLRPALHQLGGQMVEWYTLSPWARKGWHPVVVACGATQRTQSKTGAEFVGDGRRAMKATAPDGHAVQWTPFDVCPLKPRCMKAHGHTTLAIP